MNKTELIKRVSKCLDIPEVQSKKYLNILLNEIGEVLMAGEKVELQNFGTLRPWLQGKRNGRNPKNGVSCIIHPRYSVKFRPGRGLLGKLNNKSDR